MSSSERVDASRLLLPALVYCVVLLAIALAGGGWLALGRVDPLLAVPGAGWAAVATVLAMRGRAEYGAGLIAAGCGAAMLAAIGQIEGVGGLPIGAWLVAAMALAGSVLLAISVIKSLALLDVPSARARSLLSLIVWPIFAIAWANIAWVMVTDAYRIGSTDNRPRITLVTALPLTPVQFELAESAPVLRDAVSTALDSRALLTRVVGVDADVLANTDVLLLAQPPVLDPVQLVAIDGWVRRGGRTVVLADGLSSWPPVWPLGDPRNPPVTSLLGPLLSHWGVELDAPEAMRESSVVMTDVHHRVHLFSPGQFRLTGSGCRLLQAGIVGDCSVGRGRAFLVADADFLNPALWTGRQGARSTVDWRSGNMLWLLDKLETRRGHGWVEPLWSRRFGGMAAVGDAGQ